MQRIRHTALLTVLLVGALCLGACQTGNKYPPAWKSREISVPSDRLLWEVTVFALEKERYPVGTDMDPTELKALSGWRYSLAPFRGQGRRQRAEVRFETVGPQRYRVDVRVQEERNMDMARPMDLSYAEWKESPDSEESAMILLQRILAWVSPDLELSSPTAPKPLGR